MRGRCTCKVATICSAALSIWRRPAASHHMHLCSEALYLARERFGEDRSIAHAVQDTTKRAPPPGPQGIHVLTTTFVNMCVAPIRDPHRQEDARQKMFRTGRDIGRTGREAVTAVGDGMNNAGAALRRLVTGDRSVSSSA